MGSDCFLDQGIQSANDQVIYPEVVEGVRSKGLNLEDYARFGVGDKILGRQSEVGNVVNSRWREITTELQGWCCW